MIALYPSYPTRPYEPDPAFELEVQWAKAAGFGIAFVDLELQLGGAVVLRRLPEGEHDVLYRGWLIRPEEYDRLDEALKRRGCRLLESPEAYREAYEFPRWYEKLKAWTPRSLVLDPPFNLAAVAEKVSQAFASDLSEKELPGPRPVMVKDWVKSRKQDWFDACYIPDSRNQEHVKKVVSRFLELGEPIAGGLVFRQFQPFRKIGQHPKTQMPVVNEWRGFMLNGKCIYLAPYWASGDYSGVARPESSLLEDIVERSGLVSPFFALDLAENEPFCPGSSTWTVIEINSGGASGVPEGGSGEEFYKALHGGFPA